MASKVGGLGRGLDALLGGASASLKTGSITSSPNGAAAPAASDDGEAVFAIDPKLLDPNPEQPRAEFDEEALAELSLSIKEHGVLQPIIAEAVAGGRYRIIAGERRTRAAILAGIDKVPVLVRNYNDNKRLEVALVENIQRTDLNPIEEAMAYERLMSMEGLNQEELAQKVGKKRSTVANAMRLLNLSEEIQKALRDGVISAGHARALLGVQDEKERMALFHRIVGEGLNVRDAEAATKGTDDKSDKGKKGGKKLSSTDKTNKDPDIMAIEQRMLEKNGTKCRINGSLEKGKIEIDYYTRGELERLCAILT